MSNRPRKHAPSRFALAAAVCAIALLLAVAPPAAACSCMAPPPPVEAMEGADAVFSGTAVSVDDSFRETDFGRVPQRRVVVDLDRVWKGCEAVEGEERPRRLELTTGTGGGDCGFGFEEGKRYLVYANLSANEAGEGALTTGICSRTAALEHAADDVAALGEAAWVVDEAEVTEGEGDSEGPDRD